MNETPEVVTKGKKPANQTQGHMATLDQLRADACNGYMQAIRSVKDVPDLLTTSTANRILGAEIKNEAGLAWATVDGKAVSGYELITWLITGSKKKGIHHVMIGALVMAGVHDLKLFTELCGFDQDDPDNIALKTMKIAPRLHFKDFSYCP